MTETEVATEGFSAGVSIPLNSKMLIYNRIEDLGAYFALSSDSLVSSEASLTTFSFADNTGAVSGGSDSS